MCRNSYSHLSYNLQTVILHFWQFPTLTQWRTSLSIIYLLPVMKEKSHLFYLTTSPSLIQPQGLNQFANVVYFPKFYGLAIKASDQKTSWLWLITHFFNFISVILFLGTWKRTFLINLMDYSNPIGPNKISKPLYNIIGIFYFVAYNLIYKKKHINFSWIITNQRIAGRKFKGKKCDLVKHINAANPSSASAALSFPHCSQWMSQAC